MTMEASDFIAFYQRVHGVEPFPWQVRLVREALLDCWPAVLSLPTASGKTSIIDIAVFALAAQADRSPGERTAPLRLFFVIDRRLIVDEVSEHARRLAAALEQGDGIVGEVARPLLRFGGCKALEVATLRGGLYRDDAWTKAPNQPTVCVTTVDQAGSRLLFRGYGLSPYQFPVHAGLLGNDAFFILDEVHLSQPFLETLTSIAKYRTWAQSSLPLPFRVIVMSATPPPLTEAFTLTEEDERHPVLGPRLSASKEARLEVEDEANFESALIERALALSEDEGVAVIGVIVNQVRSARMMFEQLRGKHEALLLTGRIRPYDRDRLLEAWLPRMRAGRERSWDGKAFVIATQTIEVGANVDFDALVTEAAPLDALRQRFGRLDRLGRHGKSEACIMLRNRARASSDPVYGDLPQETWRWLKAHARRRHGDLWVDFGIKALNAVTASITGGDVCPRPDPVHAPVLFPSHLDLWVQTHPRPHPDPEVAPFLHGPAPQSPDVQVVWRADLKEGEEDLWRDIVALVPPRLQETLPIPIAAVRAWLHQLSEVWVSDLEGLADTGESDPTGGQGRVVLRWRGPESELVTPDRLVPGDTVVVPAAWGGADAFGWHPDARAPVPDIAEFCIEEEGLSALPSQRSLRLRLQPEV
jgi:CRISPR-associated endonuclease/helicase Cas3